MLRHNTGNLFLSKGIKIVFSKRMYLVKIHIYIYRHMCVNVSTSRKMNLFWLFSHSVFSRGNKWKEMS